MQCRVRKPPGSNVGAVSRSIPCIQSHTEASYIAMCCWPLCVPPMPFLCRILHFHPSPKFTPPVCHRLLPLPFGPLRVWIRRLRLGSLPSSGHLENPRICLQLHRADNEFFIFLLAFFFGFSSICCLRVMSPRRSSFALSPFYLSTHLCFNCLQQNLDAVVRCELQGVACDVCGVRWMCEVCGVWSEV